MRSSLLLAIGMSACSEDAAAPNVDGGAGCADVFRARKLDEARNCIGEVITECGAHNALVCSDVSICGARASDSALFLFPSDCLPGGYRSCTSAEHERVMSAESCEVRDAR